MNGDLDSCLCVSASDATNFEVDQSVFEIPESYHVQDNGRNVHLQDEDYEIMQFAIQQSLLESSRSQVGCQQGGADASPHPQLQKFLTQNTYSA